MNVIITTTTKNSYLVADGNLAINQFLANISAEEDGDGGWVVIDADGDTVGEGETELEARANALELELVSGPIVVRERKGAAHERPQVILEMAATDAAVADRNDEDDGWVYRLAGSK